MLTIVCAVCGASIPADLLEKHDEWHASLRQAIRDAYSHDELWLDGV